MSVAPKLIIRLSSSVKLILYIGAQCPVKLTPMWSLIEFVSLQTYTLPFSSPAATTFDLCAKQTGINPTEIYDLVTSGYLPTQLDQYSCESSSGLNIN